MGFFDRARTRHILHDFAILVTHDDAPRVRANPLALNSNGSLQLSDGGFISAEVGGTGNSGNITIAAGTIALVENGNITANAIAGNG